MPLAFNWLQIGLGAMVAFALSYMVATINDYRIEAQWQHKLSAQIEADTKQCNDAKLLTRSANDALVKERDAIAIKLAASKRLHPSRCILPVASKTQLPGSTGQYAGQNAVATGDLYDYAAECETIRQTSLTCIKFVDDAWKLTGQ